MANPTTNLGMTKPTVGGSTDTWGATINTNVVDIIDAVFSISGTDVTMSDIKFNSVGLQETGAGTDTVKFQAPAAVTQYTLTMPGAVGSSGQALRASDASGTLEWYTPETGDITQVAAGDGLSGGGSSGSVTLSLDLNELTAATVDVAADFIAIVDTNDSNTSRKESIADLIAAIDGTGLTASSGVLAVDAAQTQITSVGTIGTGTWQGTAVADAYVANDLTISGGTVNNSVIGGSTAAAITGTTLKADTSLELATGATVTGIDNGSLGSSATLLATQGAIKTYVDAQVGTVDTLAEVLANGNTTGSTNIIVSASQKITTDTIDETTAAAGVTIDSVLLKDNAVTATTLTGTLATAAQTNITSVGTLTSLAVGNIASTGLLTVTKTGSGANWATTVTNNYDGDNDVSVSLAYANSSGRNSGIGVSMDDANSGEYLLSLSSGGTTRFKVDGAGDVEITATQKLYLDGGSNTYLYESAADTISFATGGTDRWKIDDAGNLRSIADGSYDIGGDTSGRARGVYAKNFLTVGDNAAAAGEIRLKKDFKIGTRNAANSADKVIVSENVFTGADSLEFGDNSKWTDMRFHVSTLNVMVLTSSLISLNKAVTMNNAAIKLTGLGTSDPGVAGQLWNDSGTVKISAG
jgi:hypothetical protein